MKVIMKKRRRSGVSPVVGIIIILAVTVMLAAIVAYRAESMNSKLKNVPSTCFTLSDCPEPLSSGKVFTLTDAGGDSLIPRDIRIIVKNGSNTYDLDWNGSAFVYSLNGNTLYIPLQGEIMPGKVLTCYQKGSVFSGKTELEVEVIYKPAGAFLFRGSVWVS